MVYISYITSKPAIIPNWVEITMANQENKIDFASPNGSVIANEEFSGPIVASEWTTIEGVSGVRFKTWKYEDGTQSG
ncbi:hypothetical protein COT86_01645 [Candidatus Collierbacteria bacterium CG10_big_fil_rev_8_21_14_0_10_43_36]|uniref:Uncharacterized protein n=2 Tax=Candidatus Collieribacteriota TaxID=1752725 RepID=A0A2H0VL86_9BACT|nr:MAG: hypothetical protein COT86_01645 [Candidatus Collierbacteria bacterium CG10_big_fil_rev_8_21_14_0_10_43_36]PIZ24726.1 MAG: hypothetical protein COY48_01345 [Candidatus Collierbacteria bacterium CG_4_10_14_0_8_um_filter_43_86]PJB47042.1 MAG: hypothetical protein CO104_04820 [Candidatus Collierbacteria bacterium CG_4_9_14_3_um_filter_43_16]